MSEIIKKTIEPGALIISGKGIQEEVWLNPSDWHLNNPDMTSRYYSTNNHLGYHKILKVVGYDLLQMLELAGWNKEEDLAISFQSSDGLYWDEKIHSLQHRFCYPNLTEVSGLLVPPMIGLYVVQLFDSQSPEPPVQWEDRTINESDYDHQRPRLYKGQSVGNPSDDNQPSFLGNLVRIVVGEDI